MSTEVRTLDTDEWVCTRWCKKEAVDNGRMAVEVGSESRLARLEALALSGQEVELVDEGGERVGTLRDLLLWQTSPLLMGRGLEVTCGEWGGTVELGSGELLERLGWEGL